MSAYYKQDLPEISHLILLKPLAESVRQNRKKSSNPAKQSSGRKHYSSEQRGKNGGSRKERGGGPRRHLHGEEIWQWRLSNM